LHARTGLVGLHADIATHGFGSDWYTLADADRRTQLVDLYVRVLTRVEAPGPLPVVSEWECWLPGRAQGPLVGGLLNRLARIQATSFALPPERFDGAVLFWEEVGRPLQDAWNNLHVLRRSGVPDRIAAMVVGIPHNVAVSDAGRTPPTLRDVVLDVLGDRDFPVLGHVDFGHASPNLPLPLGIRTDVDATARTLALLEPVVTQD
jgi:muramoyltetrapeptide carboxypeptidase